MFLEIREGIFVKADSIEAIIDTTDKGVRVYTINNSFSSELPSAVILQMIDKQKEVKKEPDKNTEILDQMLNIMKTQNTPMGG